LLKEYQPPAMDEGLKEELSAYVEKRKREMPDAWY
jgi:trimethylamine--corrinoid protein Co-methyltransferase